MQTATSQHENLKVIHVKTYLFKAAKRREWCNYYSVLCVA